MKFRSPQLRINHRPSYVNDDFVTFHRANWLHLIAPPHWHQETKRLFQLSLPILGTQLAQTANGFVDTLMAGKASALDLAGVAVGSSFWVPLYLLISGILLGITPIVSQLFGRDNWQSIRTYIHQGIWLALGLGCLSWLALQHTLPLLQWQMQDPALIDITDGYLKALSWGMPAMALYMVLRCLCESAHQPKAIFVTSLIGLLCNIPLNAAFIYGYGVIPAMGGVGCGWATTCVMWLMLVLLLGYVLVTPLLKRIRLLHHVARPRFDTWLDILRVGLPIGLSIFFEVSIFAIIALLLADFGATTVAGHQIALNFSSLIFMFPLSVALALTVRVGFFQGQTNAMMTRTIIWLGLLTNSLIAIGFSIGIGFSKAWIPSWYSHQLDVQQVATGLLFWAALYQLPDALQAACHGILRGFKDTRTPMFITLVSYWMIGLPTGHLVATGHWFFWLVPEITPWGPSGYWLGLCVGLSATAILLLIRVALVYRKLLDKP